MRSHSFIFKVKAGFSEVLEKYQLIDITKSTIFILSYMYKQQWRSSIFKSKMTCTTCTINNYLISPNAPLLVSREIALKWKHYTGT